MSEVWLGELVGEVEHQATGKGGRGKLVEAWKLLLRRFHPWQYLVWEKR